VQLPYTISEGATHSPGTHLAVFVDIVREHLWKSPASTLFTYNKITTNRWLVQCPTECTTAGEDIDSGCNREVPCTAHLRCCIQREKCTIFACFKLLLRPSSASSYPG
jgi:hypothetical protein